MLVRSAFVLFASLISGLLCCSEHGAAQHIKSARYEGMPTRRAEYANEFFYSGGYRPPTRAQTPYHQDSEGYKQVDRYNSNVEPSANEENYDYMTEEEPQEEPQERTAIERAEKESVGMQTSASYAQPVKSVRTASRFSGSSYKSGYGGSSYSITLQPGAIAITCTVKDPLEHVVWLRTLCPDEYDRGDVIARGSVSSFPDVFGVAVSGEDGSFTSTLTIQKPRTQMGSGVFRCEAWPHHSEPHRRHRRQAQERAGRGHHDPWNAIIVGGAEMVDECFFNHYGDRQWRSMTGQGRTGAQTGNEISANEQPAVGFQQSSQLNLSDAPASSNLYPEFQQTDYDDLMKLLQESGASQLSDLATADFTLVPQVDIREQRQTQPQQFQRPYPVYTPTANLGKPQEPQPLAHYHSRRVNVQSGSPDVRADIHMSTDLQVHPPAETVHSPNRIAFSRMIQVQGEPQQQDR